MIKLIATDLDGSLLNDDKQTPPDLDYVMSALEKEGIGFVAVTGRNVEAVLPVFGQKINHMLLVCNNGANIYENGQLIIKHPLTKQQVHATLDLLKTIDDTTPLLFTVDNCFAAPGCDGFMEWAKAPYAKLEWVDSYEKLHDIDQDVYKISVFDGSGDITNYSYPPLEKLFCGQVAVYVSGEIWVDIVSRKASKGNGLRLIQEKLGVKKEETMAFGDYYNDESLLEQAGCPFVMDKGVDVLKERFPYRAGDNNKGGVTATIKKYVLDKTESL